jgi:hypothetical protein
VTTFRHSVTFSFLLHLLVPGLGHIYWKEYAFGLFVFLIMLLAAALFFLSFLVSIPPLVQLLLLGLPVVFYVFSFVDLNRSVTSRRPTVKRTFRAAWLFLIFAVVYQVAAPVTPINFMLRNRPDLYRVDTNEFSPVIEQGDLASATPLPYYVDLFFLDFPVYHDLPQHFDIVRYVDGSGDRRTGLVIGLPDEQVKVEDGRLIVDGYPKFHEGSGRILQSGNWPLTSVEDNSILVATLSFGQVEAVTQVPLISLVGRVNRLF